MTMRLRNVPFSPPDMTEAEATEVRDAILSGWITTGPRTKKLEKEVAEFVGVDKAVCLNSQTACGEMALRLLGISDGANLGVAAIMLYFGGTLGQFTDWPISGYMAVILAAFVGACVILGLIIYFSAKVKNNVMLLIIGIMIGYLASSVISILNYYSSTDRVHAFVMWGLGNFSGVSLEQLPFFGTCALIGLLLAILLIKPLNALLLGEMYAANLGIRIKRTRIVILLCTGVLTATTTAFCGPISFVGLAVPHIARLMLGSSNHKMLVPVTMLTGSCVALLCNMLMVVPGSNTILPLNAVTPMLGAPVIIYVIVNRKNIQYFN